MDTAWQRKYVERFYSGRGDWLDGTSEFHRMCEGAIKPGERVLEIGAGPSNRTSEYLAGRYQLEGVDVDRSVLSNTALRKAWVVEAGRYPVESGVFDACVSNYVLEHVADPFAHLREVHRVLRPRGVYLFRTPNRFHYVPLVASVTPHWFHALVANRLRGLGPEAHDPYPTVYRMNTRATILRLAAKASFEVEEIRMVEKEPTYGFGARPLFLALLVYERAVNATRLTEGLRANIFAALRKV